MKLTRVILGALSLAVVTLWPGRAHAVPIPWKNCGTPRDIVSVSQASASVWPPQTGKSITIVVRGNVNQAIPLAFGTTHVTYFPPGQVAFHSSNTYYRVFRNIPAGPFNFSRTYSVPRFLAPGTVIGIHYQESLPTGQGVMCVDMTVPFK